MDATTEAPEESFACVLRRFRAELGWSQRVTANYLGISRRSFEYWERGREPNQLTQAGAYYLLTLAKRGGK